MANHRTAQGTASHITVTQSKLSIVLGRRNSALLNDHFDQHSGEVQGLGDNSGGGGAGGKDKPWLPRGRDPAAGVTKGGVGIPHSHGAAPGQGCRLPGPSSDFLSLSPQPPVQGRDHGRQNNAPPEATPYTLAHVTMLGYMAKGK